MPYSCPISTGNGLESKKVNEAKTDLIIPVVACYKKA